MLCVKVNAGFGTSDATDFDDITLDGRYWIDPNITTGNQPSTGYGVLEVIRGMGLDSGAILQRYTVINSPAVYERIYGNGQWYPWYRSFGYDEITPYSNGKGLGVMPATYDFDDCFDAGIWWVNDIATKTHIPTGASYGFLEVIRSSPTEATGLTLQRYTQYNKAQSWHRAYVNSEWTDWFIDSSDYIYLGAVSSSAKLSFSLPATARVLIVVHGNGANRSGLYSATCTSASVASIYDMISSSYITATASGSKITLKSTLSSNMYVSAYGQYAGRIARG